MHNTKLETLILALAIGLAACSRSSQQDGETVNLAFAENIEVGAADAKAQSIVTAAEAFLQTLDAEQRAGVLYEFGDNDQRARWSNFPTSFVERGGIMRKDLSERQLAALEELLRQVLSGDGKRNARLQMAADDSLVGGDGPAADFGSDFYYIAFLGRPSTSAPWMIHVGGHHMAYNVTFVGSKASFSPMLTGGQPLTIQFEGREVYITREEVEASRALLASLTDGQRSAAIRGDEVINILLGPGSHGAVLAHEGVSGADLDETQKALLLALIEARVGQFNSRDAAAKMAEIRKTLSDTWFAWWGPTEPFGAAYFRVTGPAIMMEYGHQQMGDDITEHAHNMYREPGNDYGARWIAAD